MHLASGIIATIVLAVGVSAQFDSIGEKSYKGTVHTYYVPDNIRLPPCITDCESGLICRKHGFARKIRACGNKPYWQACEGFCVQKGAYIDEQQMKPRA
ncbi:hypothetical protein BGZ72_008200 [Mortierella alpina]|nr:hypothetical protein BGZ72_008200 [Mortierella alpina]